MSSIPTKQIDGDVSVGRNVNVGGKANIKGSVSVGHNLKVEGWLDAKNIKGANKGVFTDITKLRETYPDGTLPDGSWAIVGGTLPGELWYVNGGAWVDSGKTAGSVTVDVEQYLEEVQTMSGDIETMKSDIDSEAQNRSTAVKLLQGNIDALAQAGYRFIGVATPKTEPEMQTENVFYFSSVKGDYKNFRTVSTVNEETTYGTVKVDSGEIALLLYKGYGTSAATDDNTNTVKTGWKKITLNLDNIQRAVTQEDYDKLVSEGKVDENTYYNILEE